MTAGRHLRPDGAARGMRMLRCAFTISLAALAVSAQAQALRLVFHADAWGTPPGGAAASAALAWQAVSAVLAGAAMTCALPPSYRERRGVFCHIALTAFFLPVAGLVVVLGVLSIGCLFPMPREPLAAGRVTAPRFIAHLMARVPHGAGTRLRARLRNVHGERDDRLAALISVRALPSKATSEIARDLLADPVDEVRLLAHGMLDGMEKRIMQQIFAARAHHATSQHEDDRAHACRRLAQLYWELIYQDLVRGEVRRFTLERAEQFAHDTLAQHEDDASMWYLLGRCALLRETPDAAERYLRQAQFHRFPTERLLPWLAEAAFQKRRYRVVTQLLDGLAPGAAAVDGAKASASATGSPAVQSAVRFWTR